MKLLLLSLVKPLLAAAGLGLTSSYTVENPALVPPPPEEVHLDVGGIIPAVEEVKKPEPVLPPAEP